jgi:hypothetical protein
MERERGLAEGSWVRDLDLLSARIGTLERDVQRVEKAFASDSISPELRQRVRARFDTLLNKQRLALGALREQMAPERGKKAWAAFQTIAADCDRLFSESLAFLSGVLVRGAGLDDRMCEVADTLLDELARMTDIPWARLTTLGDEAAFDRVAGIIRVPFPEFTVWSLPVTGHEFGHVVARELREAGVLKDELNTHPFQDIVDEAGGGRLEDHLHELFADVFATYALGPSFLCKEVVLTFDPTTAYQPGATHPMSAARVHVMCRTLERMEVKPEGTLEVILDRVESTWQDGLESAGQPRLLKERIDSDALERLDRWLEDFYGLLAAELPNARYHGWLRFTRLTQELETTVKEGNLLDDIEAIEDDSLADILNAVWIYRAYRPESPAARLPEVERAGRRWALHILDRGAPKEVAR